MTEPATPTPRRRGNPLLGPGSLPPDDHDAEPAPPADVGDPPPATGEAPEVADLDRVGARRPVARRVDPTGKHALFATPPTAAPDQLRTGSRETGRAAFYSTGSRQTGTVVVTCATCTTRTRVTLVDLGIRFLSISAWIPGRRHSHWMRCPACDRHTWCRVGWLD